ncbi:MAG: CTP-dependent riboflavin kinase [Thaumarchaeota archaeon]|nr:CTP-dependent riboflavin kinase [Nitrososphaerota archaeon]
MEIRGRVFTGMGKGRYYVGHPEYQRRFEAALGYRPYPGTLNVKVEEGDSAKALQELRRMDAIRVDGFKLGEETFSSLRCFPGALGEEKVNLLIIDITYYNERVAELISPTYLRGKLGLRDGDLATFVPALGG